MENLLIMLSLLTSVSCSFPAPKNGDLVFVVGSESEMSEAITDATSGASDAHSFDHVGIVAVDGEGKVSVIEALPKKGVTETPFGQNVLCGTPLPTPTARRPTEASPHGLILITEPESEWE